MLMRPSNGTAFEIVPQAREATQSDGNRRTTLVFKNLSFRYTQEELKDTLDDQGFHGKFDFVYTPRSTTMKTNLGFAFVNFRTAESAAQCLHHFEGRPLQGEDGGPCLVMYARVQGGLAALEEVRRGKRNKGRAEPLLISDTGSFRSAYTNSIRQAALADPKDKHTCSYPLDEQVTAPADLRAAIRKFGRPFPTSTFGTQRASAALGMLVRSEVGLTTWSL